MPPGDTHVKETSDTATAAVRNARRIGFVAPIIPELCNGHAAIAWARLRVAIGRSPPCRNRFDPRPRRGWRDACSDVTVMLGRAAIAVSVVVTMATLAIVPIAKEAETPAFAAPRD